MVKKKKCFINTVLDVVLFFTFINEFFLLFVGKCILAGKSSVYKCDFCFSFSPRNLCVSQSLTGQL